MTSARSSNRKKSPVLGNGGLGRLAACYMDSLATLNVPAIGYGIRYEFGIFDQAIRDGWQVERTDKWLRFGNPWEIVRTEVTYDVCFGGRTEAYHDAQGNYRVRWIPERMVKGVAYDTPVPGYGVPTANLLRLWKAEATESFDLDAFNVGDYYGAVHEKAASETISKVLYPNDEPEIGKTLRLTQQFFFVSCSLQDMIRLHLMRGKRLEDFHQFWAAQLNDTHPSIAIAELMRLPRGRAHDGLGYRVGDHAADLRVYEPHAALRGAREMAAAAVRASPAASPGNHLRDQPPLPRRPPQGAAGRR
jgi:starch phosphorylase